MLETVRTAFLVAKALLTFDDISHLKKACQLHLEEQDSISAYVMIDQQRSAVLKKIKDAAQQATDRSLHYLNDFYSYTDKTFAPDWHIDTEQFSFQECLNAWILLSPSKVQNPISFMKGINEPGSKQFHTSRIQGDRCVFVNLKRNEWFEKPLAEIVEEQMSTPLIEAGDVLFFNPGLFHKIGQLDPTHALVMKFAAKGNSGFRSDQQVPAMFWPEVDLFNKMLADAGSWDAFLGAVREQLATPKGRALLSAGFYPDNIELYRKMVRTL